MIVSWNWLQKYVTLECDHETAADRLMMAGLNLEGIEAHGDDFAIDLEVTSNRPDCLGHIGVARELTVLFDCPLAVPEAEIKPVETKTSSITSVENESPDHCPHYMARVIRGVKVGPSPDWLKEKLEVLGLRSVNNVVDVTNYVLLECGQPLHAFDFNKLSEQRIIVRQAREGEKLVAIDGKEYTLDEQTCVIADAEKPVAIAGVMGGQETEVTDQTTDLLIETASFAPLSVRRTARNLSLFSDSSFRFERGVDIQQLDWASRRCCELIQELAGGEVLDEPVLIGEIPKFNPEPIPIRFEHADRLLGIKIIPNVMREILSHLGLREVNVRIDHATFKPPSWRADLTREADLIEEVARIYGYDKIPENCPPGARASMKSNQDRTTDLIHQTLNAGGFYEAITLAFTSEKMNAAFNPQGISAPLQVEHSSRKLENVLRSSLIPNLLVSRRANERAGNVNAQLYEIARVFTGMTEQGAEQTLMLSCVTGHDFQHLKGILEHLLSRVRGESKLVAQPSDVAGFAPGRGAELIIEGQQWGWMGELDRSVTDQFDLKDAVTVAELKLNPLIEQLELAPQYELLPQYPASERDFNFLLEDSVTWEQLAETMKGSGGELLESVSFAGQYRGKQIGAGKKTYLARASFRSPERTLTGEEVDVAHGQIVKACEQELAAELR